MSDDFVSKPITSKDLTPVGFYGSGGTFLTITKDGKIILGEGLSQDDATQATARMLAEQFSALHQKQAAEIAAKDARIAELEAALDQLLDDMRDGLCVCQQAKDEARAALGGKDEK